MRAQKVKPLDIENGYMYHKKAQYVENFNDFLIMVFLNIVNTVFQTSFEKCFYGKKGIHLTKLICISNKITVLVWFYSKSLAVFVGLFQDFCFVIHALLLNPFGFRVDSKGWWFEHSMS